MNILHFSTDDTTGGAAKAAHRIHTALRAAGHSSRMIVRNKVSGDEAIQKAPLRIWRYRFRQLRRSLPLIARKKLPAANMFNFDIEPDLDTTLFYSYRPDTIDVINLHWITGLLTVEMIKRLHEYYRCPLVWTLMDQEPLTGGCHYSFGCDGFTKQCGNCPQLNSRRAQDRSRFVWRRKNRYLHHLPIVFVSPDHWSAARARESSLFRAHRVERIPYAIDTTVFRPFDQRAARDLLHVPQNRRVVFFGSYSLQDTRKGMAYLADALRELSARMSGKSNLLGKDSLFFLAAGHRGDDLMKSLPFAHRNVGYLTDDITLALTYQAADVFVCPSVEDAGPLMISESMLCGTPVIAFKNIGDPEIIRKWETGYLAEYKDSSDLANGLYAMLTAANLPAMRAAAHAVAESQHSPSVVAARYLQLYDSLRNTRQEQKLALSMNVG